MTWFTDIQPLTNHQRKHLWADRYDGYQRVIPTELRSLRSAEPAAARDTGNVYESGAVESRHSRCWVSGEHGNSDPVNFRSIGDPTPESPILKAGDTAGTVKPDGNASRSRSSALPTLTPTPGGPPSPAPLCGGGGSPGSYTHAPDGFRQRNMT